ncbi:MAG: hypothetical protein SWO11_15225 [Thermodesulfobacteriota bacterium]|nr:hypothetical protein [Thermodesulfobacteriota bacterium]
MERHVLVLKDMPISADTGYYSVTNLKACNWGLMLICRILSFAKEMFVLQMQVGIAAL